MSFPEKRKRRFGDRVDGHRLKNGPSMNVLMGLLYPNRCDCEVSARYEMDVTDLLEYIRKRNEKNPECKIKFFHCFITALVRTLCERPKLLRFLRGGRMYERDEITVSFVAKRKFADNAQESLLTYKARKDDSLNNVSRFITGEVSEIRKEVPKTNGAEDIIESVTKIPLFFRKIIVRTGRALDYWGILPKGLTHGDPAFSTVLVANLGSIRCPSAYHHLNNYGSCSIMITIGTLEKKNFLQEDGSVITKDIVEITATCDERIADGFYFSKSMKLLERILKTPELLEKPFAEESGIDEAIR